MLNVHVLILNFLKLFQNIIYLLYILFIVIVNISFNFFPFLEEVVKLKLHALLNLFKVKINLYLPLPVGFNHLFKFPLEEVYLLSHLFKILLFSSVNLTKIYFKLFKLILNNLRHLIFHFNYQRFNFLT